MPRRSITIRSRLLRDLSILVVGLGLVTITVMAVGGRRAVRSLADVLMSQTLATVESRLDAFFDGMEHQLGIVAGQVAGSPLDLDPGTVDPEAALVEPREARNQLMRPVISASPPISSLMLADGLGRGHMLLRTGEQWRTRLTAADQWPSVRWYAGAVGEEPELSRETSDYDPRERPWFQGAAAGDPGEVHWTEPYIFFTTRQLGITGSTRLAPGPGRAADAVPRVIGFDVLLRDLTDFTRSLAVGEQGVVTVLTGDGRMIGLPDLPAFEEPGARDAAYLQRPEELGLTLVDDAVAARRTLPADQRVTFRFSSGGETWWGASEPYRLTPDRFLRIAVLIPERELLGNLSATRLAVVGLVVLVLVVGVARTAVVARRFSQPIEAVAAESRRITDGDLEPGPPITSPFREIRHLVAAQDHLREGIAARLKLEKVERDLDIAREIQRGLLPPSRPAAPGFVVAGWNQPADETGGDYYDWMELPDGRVLVALADATGHGIGPALIVAVCRAYMRAAAVGEDIPLIEALGRVNDLLHADLPAEKFVTMAVGVLDPAKATMTLVSAGQAPLYFRRADGRLETWDADVPPMGIMTSLPFEAPRIVTFEPGDTLVITTDGYFEWADPRHELFGTERLERLVADRAGEHPDAFIPALEQAVVEHAAGTPQPDDLTVLVVQRLPAGAA